MGIKVFVSFFFLLLMLREALPRTIDVAVQFEDCGKINLDFLLQHSINQLICNIAGGVFRLKSLTVSTCSNIPCEVNNGL